MAANECWLPRNRNDPICRQALGGSVGRAAPAPQPTGGGFPRAEAAGPADGRYGVPEGVCTPDSGPAYPCGRAAQDQRRPQAPAGGGSESI